MDYQKIIEEIEEEIQPLIKEGKVADYIPALANSNINDFAMSIIELNGKQHSVGCSQKLFSIQSISKVFTFTIALKIYCKNLYKSWL